MFCRKSFINLVLFGLWVLFQVALASSVQIGKVNHSDALIAIVQNEENLLIYVCGGEQDWASHTSWFRGTKAEDGSFYLTGQDGLSISGQLAENAAKGQLILADGQTASWQSLAISEESPAALYRYASETEVAGFIVAQSQESVGSIRLIRPAVTEVLPLWLESDLAALALPEVKVCYLQEAGESCLSLQKFQ